MLDVAFIRLDCIKRSLSAMKTFSVLMLTVGIIRVFGGFPYTWSLSPPTFSRHKVLVAWTVTAGLLYISSVVLVRLTNDFNAKKISNLTVKVCIGILNTSGYLVSASLLGHAIYRHRLLLGLLKALLQVPGIRLEERLTRREKVAFAVILVIVFGHFSSLFFLFFFVIERNSFSRSVILYLSRFPFDGVTFTVPVFFHLVVRMLTSALEDIFQNSPFYVSLIEKDGKEGQNKKFSDRGEQASGPVFLSSQEKTHRHPPLATESLRSFTYDILKQYDALEKIISYIQLPALVLLLNEIVYSTVMTYFMVAEIHEQHNMAVPLSFLCCSLFRATLLVNTPDHMADKVMAGTHQSAENEQR